MFNPKAAVLTLLDIMAGCDSARACLKFPAAVVKLVKVKNAAGLQRQAATKSDRQERSLSTRQ